MCGLLFGVDELDCVCVYAVCNSLVKHFVVVDYQLMQGPAGGPGLSELLRILLNKFLKNNKLAATSSHARLTSS